MFKKRTIFALIYRVKYLFMTTEKLEKLRGMVKNHDNFMETQSFFFDFFADNPKFMSASKPIGEESYKELMNKTLREMPVFKGKSINLRSLRVMKYAQTDLIHGSGFLSSGGVATILFFENEEMGLMGVVNDFLTGVNHFTRIKIHREDGANGGSFVDKNNLNMN
jgi:hypothetical protein